MESSVVQKVFFVTCAPDVQMIYWVLNASQFNDQVSTMPQLNSISRHVLSGDELH